MSGPGYRVAATCAMPDCQKWAEHAHHLVRRSQLKGDYAWVRLPDGVIVGNLVGLCVSCHADVTGGIGGHRAAIRYHEGAFWKATPVEKQGGASDGEIGYALVSPLSYQPPCAHDVGEAEIVDETAHSVCPSCGHVKRPSPALPPGAKRKRKSWTVSVPDDVEDGADLLDSLLDDFSVPLGADSWPVRNRRYWVLTHVLAWVAQRREEFARDAADR